MGTRGLLAFIINGKKRGFYNRFDSYHSGLGAVIVLFILLLNEGEWDEMRKKLEGMNWIEDADSMISDAEKNRLEDLVSIQLDVNMDGTDPAPLKTDPFDAWPGEATWCTATSPYQAGVCLPHILCGQLHTLPDSVNFDEDGVFCEYAYYVDFAKKTFSMNRSLEGRSEWTFEKLGNVEGYWYALAAQEAARLLIYAGDREITGKIRAYMREGGAEPGGEDEPEAQHSVSNGVVGVGGLAEIGEKDDDDTSEMKENESEENKDDLDTDRTPKQNTNKPLPSNRPPKPDFAGWLARRERLSIISSKAYSDDKNKAAATPSASSGRKAMYESGGIILKSMTEVDKTAILGMMGTPGRNRRRQHASDIMKCTQTLVVPDGWDRPFYM